VSFLFNLLYLNVYEMATNYSNYEFYLLFLIAYYHFKHIYIFCYIFANMFNINNSLAIIYTFKSREELRIKLIILKNFTTIVKLFLFAKCNYCIDKTCSKIFAKSVLIMDDVGIYKIYYILNIF